MSSTWCPYNTLVKEIESSQNLVARFQRVEDGFSSNFAQTRDRDWLEMRQRLQNVKYQLQINGHASSYLMASNGGSSNSNSGSNSRRQESSSSFGGSGSSKKS